MMLRRHVVFLMLAAAAPAACSSFGSAPTTTEDAGAVDSGPGTDASVPDVVKPDVVVDGLVGWWKFDEGNGSKAHDSSPSGADGVTQGGATLVAGERGGTLTLDGIDGWVFVPSHPKMILGATFTVAMWTNIVRKEGDGGTYNERLLALDGVFDIKLNGTPELPQLTLGDDSAFNSNAKLPVNGAWHHLAITFNRGAVKVWINGVGFVAQVTAPLSPNGAGLAPASVTIGAGPIGPTKGRLDDVRLYTRVLSDAEIDLLAKE